MHDIPILRLSGITKEFPGVLALNNVSVELMRGEVLCLAGENGAGKSTLIKILSGIHQPEAGEIRFEERAVKIKNPSTAIELGISVVYQEHKLIGNLSVAENIFFGRFPMTISGIIDFRKLHRDTQAILAELGINLTPRTVVDSLNSSQAQMVEIAKAYSMGSKVMILDEPSAAITDTELVTLFALINNLKKTGKSFIYVSHRLHELLEVGDRVAVLKDGALVGVRPIAGLNVDSIISMMIGRNIDSVFGEKPDDFGRVVLRAKNISNNAVSDCSFSIREGEIVGFYGLVGSGRSELAESVFGYRKKTQGTVEVDGREVSIKRPMDAIKSRIGFVTEDRKSTGLILNKSVGFNLTFAILKTLTRMGVIDTAREAEVVRKSIADLKIKTYSDRQEAELLSGGNQQKVVLGKWLNTNSKVLICDEPTKGIDVGTKQEFYAIINQLARSGMGIMLISSELLEIIGLSNRVYVMRNGRITAELQQGDINEETIAAWSMKDAPETAEAG